jgi:hypothetical protein
LLNNIHHDKGCSKWVITAMGEQNIVFIMHGAAPLLLDFTLFNHDMRENAYSQS